MTEVRAYDGSQVVVTGEAIDHIARKHPQMLSIVGFGKEQLLSALIQALEDPTKVFLDARGSRYFILKAGDLYLNVIVIRGSVKTAYLIGERTYARMRKARWLRRLY